MFKDLDETIEQLLKIEFGGTLPFDLSFAVPDSNFNPVSTTRGTLNCFLYNITEDRGFRGIEPVITRTVDNLIEKKYPPARVKVSYCFSAWSPATATPGLHPALDEHDLLGDVLRALLKYPELPEAALQGSLASSEFPLPTSVIFPEGVKNGGEFWKSVGGQLKPSLDYSVTIAMPYRPTESDPMVTTLASSIYQSDMGAQEGMRFDFGGLITANVTPVEPVANAWVLLVEKGTVSFSDAEGRFTIEKLPAGSYTLKVRAAGYHEGTRNITVPGETGDFDLRLSPV